jgi:2-oxoglutarate dehydrogenase E2 component (dihydrolipoamide succinyltransferase)
MPKLGESIMEATILKWHKKVGETIEQDETLLDIATDKVDSEVPSTAAGTLTEILFKENDVVAVDAVIARISTNATDAAAIVQQPEQQLFALSNKEPYETPTTIDDLPFEPAKAPLPQPVQQKSAIRFYSPLVLKIAQEEGINFAELENIPGTGAEGRVSKNDILAYLANGRQPTVGSQQLADYSQQPAVYGLQTVNNIETSTLKSELPTAIPQPPTANRQPPSAPGNVEIIEMDRMRKLIAKHMVDSKHTSPHVTSFTEADVTNMVLWREKTKHSFEKREGTKITFMPLFIEAIVKCIKKYPLINCSLDGDNIILKKDINIGMATALPSGNLIVPVIKNADQLNLVGLSKQVNSLAEAARNNKLRPNDTTGGTFTLTNVGTFGSLMGTPIINQPQVAILAVGAIKKRPMVIETSQGDSIAIRHIMYLSMSYDHRVVDGSLGASFLTAVAKELENFDGDRGL